MAEGGASLLPQPPTPVEMKVFQGGGSTEGESLLRQPLHEAPLTEYKGGGVGSSRPSFLPTSTDEFKENENDPEMSQES